MTEGDPVGRPYIGTHGAFGRTVGARPRDGGRRGASPDSGEADTGEELDSLVEKFRSCFVAALL